MKRGTALLKAQKNWIHNDPEPNNGDNRRLKLFFTSPARVRLKKYINLWLQNYPFQQNISNITLHRLSFLLFMLAHKKLRNEKSLFISWPQSILLIFQFIYSNTSPTWKLKEGWKINLRTMIEIFNFISMVWFGLNTYLLKDLCSESKKVDSDIEAGAQCKWF